MRHLPRAGALCLLGLLVLPALAQKDAQDDPRNGPDRIVQAEKKTPDVSKDIDKLPPDVSKDIDKKKPDVSKDIDKKAPDVSKDIDKKKPDVSKDIDKKPAPDVKKDVDKKKPDVSKDVDKKTTTGQTTNPNLKKDLDKGVNTERMVQAGQLAGKIMSVAESNKSIRIQITLTYTVLDEGEANGLLQAQVKYQQALYKRPPDLNALRDAQIDMLRHQAKLYKIEQKTQDLEVKASDDVKVRTLTPPEVFDDKGELKKLTAQDLKELKGDNPRLPGYNAEFSDLHEGQLVQVNLTRKPGAPIRSTTRRGKDTDPDLLLSDYEPKASVIVILGETRAPGS